MTTVLITGANRGLGLEFTRQYAADGATVIACARNPKTADELNALAKDSEGRIRVEALDVTNGQAIARLAVKLEDETIDLLINNAGIMGPAADQSLDMADYDQWTATLETNVIGVHRVSTAFLPNLRKAGRPVIIAISSGLGSIEEASGGLYAYRTSKAGVNMVMRAMANDLREDAIIAVPLDPGWVQTDMGGARAPTPVDKAVADMRGVIGDLRLEQSGRFMRYDGGETPW